MTSECTGKPLHKEVYSTHRSFYIHREVFTLTEKSLHTEDYTHGQFYTEKSFHRRTFTQKNFYTEELLHRAAFTQESLHRNLYTGELCFYIEAHRRIYIQKLSHGEVFSLRSLYT